MTASRTTGPGRVAERLDSLFTDNPCPMWIVDESTHAFRDVNEAAIRTYGYSRDEFLAMSGDEVRRRFFDGGARHASKDGGLIDVETSSCPVEWSGRPALLVVIQDVTRRADIERALRAGEERFRLICRATSDAVWDWDIASGAVWTNESAADVLGYRAEELGTDVSWWVERIHPEERDAVHASVQRVLETGGEIWTGEYRFLRADGAYAHISDRGYVLRDPGGRPIRMIGAMLDVTERRRALQALQESEERRRQMAEAIQDVFWLSDARTNEIIYINPAFTRVWGRSRREILKRPRAWLEAVHPDDRERVRRSLNDWKPEGEAPEWNQEYRMVRPDGTVRWLWSRSFPVRDAKGEIVRFAGVERDITQRKQAEEALRSLLSITRELSSTLDVDALMVTIVKGTLRLLEVEGGCAGLMTPQGMTCRKFCTETEVRDFSHTWRPGRGLAGWVAVHKVPYITNDAANDPQMTPALRKQFGVKAAICTPLLDPQGEVIGFIHLLNKKDGSAFGKQDEEKLVAVSRAASVAVQNALAYRKLRESAEALRLAELKYRGIFENSPEGIGQAAPDGRVVAANPALARMLGYGSPEDLIAAAAAEPDHGFLVDPALRQEMKRVLDRDGELSGVEVQVRRKDGTPIWVLVNLRAVLDETGEILHYDGIVQDITPRKKTEDALREVSGLLLQSQNQERRRIARELHDSTAQSLAALAMNLGLINKTARGLDARTRKHLTESLRLAEQSCREIRTLSYLLHPPELEDADLWSAVRWYAEGFSSRSGIRVDLSMPGPAEAGRIPGPIETTLFRIVQESLANIHRHSGSRRARIRIGRSKTGVTLTVRDEGKGMRTLAARRAGREMLMGVGIAGMRERVRQLGGRIEIDSGTRGTCVRVTVPVPREH